MENGRNNKVIKILLCNGRTECGFVQKLCESSWKCALTLHSVTDELNINEQNTSIATGSLYLYIEFDAI